MHRLDYLIIAGRPHLDCCLEINWSQAVKYPSRLASDDSQLELLEALHNVIVQKLKVKSWLTTSIYPNHEQQESTTAVDQQQKSNLQRKLSGGRKRLFSFILTFDWATKHLLDELTAASLPNQRFAGNCSELKKAPRMYTPVSIISAR